MDLNEQLGCKCNILLKIHILFLHLDFFPANCGDMNDEYGERLRKYILVMELTYIGKWNAAILGYYYSMIKGDTHDKEYRRQTKRQH